MSLLQMSASGALMVLVTVIIRVLAIHRLPKRTFLALWGVAVLRLLLPYSLPSACSVYSLWQWAANRLTPAPATTVAFPSVSRPLTALTVTAATASGVPTAAVAAPGVDLWTAVWLTGVLACTAFFTVAYVRCRQMFQCSLPVSYDGAQQWLAAHRLRRPLQIRQSDRISSPLTYGVLRPVILMPKSTDWTDQDTLKYVLTHEFVHIRRFDAVAKLAIAAVLCIHWFNPAVWILYTLANRDMELSCDEAVIRLLGPHTRSGYAMTLIRMEEIKSGLTSLCNHFSRNAMEERIIAIMKTKQTSLAALATAAALITGVTVGFATSARADTPAVPSRNANLPFAQTAEENRDVILTENPGDGLSYYSWNNGETWTPITDEVRTAQLIPDEAWWTAEEYEAWLEQEKLLLRDIIGEQGWTPSTGWFTWTQEKVDETIAAYERTLNDIRNGLKLSKPSADGDAMIVGFIPSSMQTSMEQTDSIAMSQSTFVTDKDGYIQSGRTQLLAEYEPFGLTYNADEDAMYFRGLLVRYFFDGVDIEDAGGTIVAYDYWNENGVVDVYTVRQATLNDDGSTNPMGKLVDVRAYSQDEFDSRDTNVMKSNGEATTDLITYGTDSDCGGITFEDRFAQYRNFGITYVEAENASGAGNVYYNGQLVACFIDRSPTGVFSFQSRQPGAFDVQTVYDADGTLIDVVPLRAV